MKFLLLILLSINLYAISEKEIYNIAKHYTNYPSTIVAIAKQESSLGKEILGDDGNSLGLMQIQVPTARWIATKDQRLTWVLNKTDKELETLLLRSDTLSIMITCIHFEFWRKRSGYKMAIIHHNGVYTKDKNGKRILNLPYYNRIMKRMNR